VGVETQHEGDEEVVGIPEGLERLLADLGVGGGIHEEHAQEHDVAGDTAGVHVMDLYSERRAELGPFDIVEVDVVTGGVDDGKEQHGIGDLAMEPDVLVEGQPPDLRSDPSHNRSADGEKDQGAIDSEDETGAARNPNRMLQEVERSEARIGGLLPPR